MLRVVDYANMALHVYGKPFVYEIYDKIKYRSGTGIYRIDESNIDAQMNLSNNFYAQLYIILNEGKATDAVLAIRGTDNVENMIVDAETWEPSVLSNEKSTLSLPLTAQYYQTMASLIFWSASEYLLAHFPELPKYKLNVTGHSLGGALAALLPAHMHLQTTAVTFNAPGIKTVKGVTDDMWNRVYTVEARYDYVSKVGEQYGHVYYVDVPNKESQAKKVFEYKKLISSGKTSKLDGENLEVDFTSSLMAQHKIKNLVDALYLEKNRKVASMLIP